jgi:K(+)-stimulated pyrophosphate-energized sodium pump
MNPVIKFTTLFGLLAVELGVKLAADYGPRMSHVLAAAFLLGSAIFVWRSFYAMRIRVGA